MDQANDPNGTGISPAEYLRGALASRHIVNTSRRIDCAGCNPPTGELPLLYLTAPRQALTNTVCELRLRIGKTTDERFSGTLHLRGTGNIRHRDYEFSAPFEVADDETALCLAFQWLTPDYPTLIEWAASIEPEKKMGLTLTDIARVMVVKPQTPP
ncbi:hypothetical protein EDC39_104202 [Geothermobacter ehrlichii]|uniref:Uncharacterized protein n=1 Tax=Geothermobacter ehrlichii TaxID=213224 RepID=A0A5D3WL18_9BACT|nr:hypothetical protein [Geothermobacter ehrlichii]TYO99078.1 hypothetical protein EDC39_104202 [Geothermobacter ehrlichii]